MQRRFAAPVREDAPDRRCWDRHRRVEYVDRPKACRIIVFNSVRRQPSTLWDRRRIRLLGPVFLAERGIRSLTP
jgi:hypothetical protein